MHPEPLHFRSRPIIVVATTNDAAILENCLLRSPEVRDGLLPVRTYAGYASASLAYNAAIDAAPPGAILVLVHQDIYLPAGTARRFVDSLEKLEAIDPDWGVLAGGGMTAEFRYVGLVWTTSWEDTNSGPGALPARIVTADECMLIIRADPGLRFDDGLPSYHLYATDIIQMAGAAGRASYAIDLPVVHHDRVKHGLDAGFRAAYRYMAAKWRRLLPLQCQIVSIEDWPLGLWRRDYKMRKRARRLGYPPTPMSDPSIIARAQGWE